MAHSTGRTKWVTLWKKTQCNGGEGTAETMGLCNVPVKGPFSAESRNMLCECSPAEDASASGCPHTSTTREQALSAMSTVKNKRVLP